MTRIKNKTYNTALKTVLLAVSMMFITSTIIHASQENNQTQINTYKQHAQKALQKYHQTLQYKYYNQYLHLMKKHTHASHATPTLQKCEAYGTLAGKYQEAYEKFGYKIYQRYATVYTRMQSRCQAHVNKEGKVVGKVILDHGSKTQNKPLANIEVRITDAKGKVTTVKTNKKGYYFAPNIANGEANVTIINPHYEDKTLLQSIGTNPSSVTVKPFRRNWANIDGYTYVTALTLTAQEDTLNKGTSTTLSILATYSNGTTKEDTNVSFTVNPATIAQAEGRTLTALSDGDATLTASIDDIISNPVALNVYWEVDGHRLPPQPDETLNNSTLLGIDSNDNGVRDDVERFVYEHYKDVHPVNIAVAMQAARAYQILMDDPIKAAKELHSEMSAPLYCEFYYANDAKYFGEEILIPKEINTKTFRQGLIFNTEERKNAYYIYNATLSGGAYTLPKSEELKGFCDDAVREVMK